MKTIVGSAGEALARKEKGEEALCLAEFVGLLTKNVLGLALASHVERLWTLSSQFAAETQEDQKEIVLEARRRQRFLPSPSTDRMPTLDVLRFRDEELLFRVIDLVEEDRAQRTKTKKLPRLETFVSGYHAALHARGWIDERSALLALAVATEKLSPIELLEAMGTNRVVARNLFRFDKRDLVFWHALSEKLGAYGEVRFELPYVRRSLYVERSSDPLERHVRDVESLRLLPPSSVDFVDRLADILEGKSEAATNWLSLSPATSLREECDAIATNIASLVASGVSFDRIAIGITERTPRDTLRDLERALLDRELRPAFGGATDVAIFSRFALFLGSATWDKQDALRLVRIFSAGKQATPREEAWRTHVQQSSFSGRSGLVAALLEAWNSLPAPEESLSDDENPGPSCVEEVLRLGALFANDRGEHEPSAKEHAAKEPGTIVFLDAVELLLAHPFFAGRTDLDLARTLVTALRSSPPTAGYPLDAQAFLRLLEAHTLDSPRATQTNQIVIAPFRELHGHALHSLFVPTVHEYVFPEPKIPDAASDKEQDKPWIGLRPRHERLVDAEYSEFTLAVSAAEHVVLSFHSTSSETRDAVPAALIAELRERSVPSVARVHGAPTAPTLSPRQERAVRITKEREQFHGTKRRSKEVGKLGLSEGEESVALRALRRSMGAEARSVSVTQFDRALQCAAKGFYSATLGIREPEIAQAHFSPKDRGILLHKLLESALRATLPLWLDRPRPVAAIREGALRAFDEALIGEGHPLRALDREKTVAAATHLFDETLSDLDWDPTGVEVQFGRGANLPPAHLLFGETKLTLHGTMDRIDRSSDGRKLRVVDYKSSLLTRKNTDPFSLQVQTYSAALRAGHPELTIEGGTYLSAKYEQKQGVPFDQARFQDAVAPRAETLLSGIVTPEPIHEAVCEYCPYDLVCRKPRFPIELVEGASNE